MASEAPLLIFVGGFLGAGKTSLILCAANLLQRSGARVAVITNDQGGNLVDTRRMRAEGFDTAEIGGGCFCCRFSDLIDAADSVMRYRPEVIFAEPVGSCTDLAATVVRPLQSLYGAQFRVAPLTVLIDPEMAIRALDPDGDPAMRFLFDCQVREADLLCYSKADQYEYFPSIGNDEPLRVSSRTCEGVRTWINVLYGWSGMAGRKPLQVDYDLYAASEAALGWLNARVEMALTVPASPSTVVGPLLDRIDQSLTQARINIMHLKLFDQTVSSYLKAAIVNNRQDPTLEGDLLATAERHHELIINLRAVSGPDELKRAVEQALSAIEGDLKMELEAFAPAYPRPQHRL